MLLNIIEHHTFSYQLTCYAEMEFMCSLYPNNTFMFVEIETS